MNGSIKLRWLSVRSAFEDAAGDGFGRVYRRDVLNAAGRTSLSRGVACIAQLVVLAVAARMLTPFEFGVFAIIQCTALIVIYAAGAGWREFALAWRGAPAALGQGIGVSLFVGYIAGLASLGASMEFGRILSYPFLTAIAAPMAICVLFAPLSEISAGMLLRQNRINTYTTIEIASDATAVVIALAGLFGGYGAVALAAAMAVRSLFQALTVALFSGAAMAVRFSGGHFTTVMGAVGHYVPGRLFAAIPECAGVLIAGLLLGPAAAGLYRAGERIVTAIAELIFEPLRLATKIFFRQALADHDDEQSFSKAIRRQSSVFFPIVFLLVAPVFVGLSLIADVFVGVLLGADWLASAAVVSILAIARFLSLPHVSTAPLLTLTGEDKRTAAYDVFGLIILIGGALFGSRYGIVGIAGAALGASAFMLAAAVWLQWRYANANWSLIARSGLPIYSALTALCCAILGFQLFVPDTIHYAQFINLVGSTIIGGAAYIAVVLLLKPQFLRQYSA